MTAMIGNADAFPILKHWNFLNHAAVAPQPKSGADVFRTYATQIETAAYLSAGWHADIEKLRDSSAKLINGHRDEIAFIKNTSEGICTVAKGIDWKPGDRIITTGVEYPANIYPWMEAERMFGCKLVMVPEEDGPDGCRHVPIERIFAAASEARTRMIALSHVEFGSGQRHDLVRIGEFCAQRKILLSVDAIQSMGIVPVDVRAMHIDFLSADGHKWLLGPLGAGIFYCRKELLDQLRPLTIGWMNVVDATNFGRYEFKLRPDAARYECGAHNVPGLLSLKASVDLLLDAGIDRIVQRIKGLTDLLIDGLRGKGYHVVSPRTALQWSGIVSFTSPRHDQEKIFKELHDKHRIEIASRVGRLRCSPHFYNTEEQIRKLVEVLPGH